MTSTSDKVAQSPGAFDPVDNFEDFLRFYSTDMKEGKSIYKYRELVHEAYSSSKCVIYVLYDDLLDYDPKLANELVQNPDKILDDCTEAFKNLLRIEAGGKINEELDYFVRFRSEKEILKQDLRKLYSQSLNQFILVKAMVVRKTPVNYQLITATFECQDCGHQFELEQFDTILIKPAKCMNPGCKNKAKFLLVEKDSDFINWQSLWIQESPEELPSGEMPRQMKCIVTHDLVDRVRPGDRITAMGAFRPLAQQDRKGSKTTIFRPLLQVNSIESRQTESEDTPSTEDEIKEFYEWAHKSNIHLIIERSIASSIKNLDHIKKAIALFLFGGNAKWKPDGGKIRGDIHVLLVGDPSLGKSVLLKSAKEKISRSIFTSGKGSSAAGLTCAVIKDGETGGWTLEAGVVVLCDGGIACIDEFDKMDVRDRVAIHESMEQQTCSISKAGLVATLNARCGILAAANPHLGRYNPWKTASDNIRLSPPLLSRFDLIFVMIDSANPKNDKEIGSFIIDLHQKSTILKNYNEERVRSTNCEEDTMSPEFLKKYIAYARRYCHPRISTEPIYQLNIKHKDFKEDMLKGKGLDSRILTILNETELKEQSLSQLLKKERSTPQAIEEALAESISNGVVIQTDVGKKILNFYLKYRGLSGEAEKAGEQPIAIVARNLEGIIRLSEAHAKMALREEVIGEDVDSVLDLVQKSLSDVGYDKETGTFDIDRLMTGHSRSQVSRIGKVLEILRDMEEENLNKPVEISALMERVELEGEMIEKDITEAITTLKKEGDVVYPKDGLIKSVKH